MSPHHFTVKDIIHVCCLQAGTVEREFLGPRRCRRISWPRQRGMYIARKFLNRSWSDIATRFGRSDHTTPIRAHRRVEWRMARDEQEKIEVDWLVSMLLIREQSPEIQAIIARRAECVAELQALERAERALKMER